MKTESQYTRKRNPARIITRTVSIFLGLVIGLAGVILLFNAGPSQTAYRLGVGLVILGILCLLFAGSMPLERALLGKKL
jgi:hypothetical protein